MLSISSAYDAAVNSQQPPWPDDDGDTPFGGIPILGDLSALITGSRATMWEGAQQTARQIATGGGQASNVLPAQRFDITQIMRVAELCVQQATGWTLSPADCKVTVVTRADWAADAFDAVRPILERLATQVGAPPDDSDPIAQIFSLLSPMMVAMSGGTMTGHLAQQAMGTWDLPVPRQSPGIMLVAENIAAFASEWSLSNDDVALWAGIRELTLRALACTPHIDNELRRLLHAFAEGYERDHLRAADALADLESAPQEALSDQAALAQQFERVFSNPEVLLGVTRSSAQEAVADRLEQLLGLLAAYADHVVELAGAQLIGGYTQLCEALARRRVTGGEGDVYAQRLLGVQLKPQTRTQAAEFIDGVIERAGTTALDRLWRRVEWLPTPQEFVAPGLWLERIDLPLSDGAE